MKPVERTTLLAPELVPIERLERDIQDLCIGINAATYELLVKIREFDERVGFLKWGLESTAEWLAWRCDYSMTTALEKVRVAQALKNLPGMSREFSSGALSYSKVRALTRVGTVENEEELLAFALRHTTSHVVERCWELRMGSADSSRIAERACANRFLKLRRDADRAVMVANIELPLEAGELLEKALDKARDDAALDHPDIIDTSWSKRQADAFVTMVQEFFAGGTDDYSAHSHLVNVHVDQAALAGEPGKSSLPRKTGNR